MFFLRQSNGWQPLPFLGGSSASLEFLYYFIPQEPLPAEYRLGSSLPLEDRIFLMLAWADTRAHLRVHPFQGMLLSERLDLDYPPGKRSPMVAERLSQLADSRDARRQVHGIRIRIEQGDLDALRKLAAEHQRHRSDHWGWQGILRAVRSDLPPVPGAVPVLASLTAGRDDPQLRVAATVALARIHSRETLPHLARLLDDTDYEVRAYAVGGLAMFANNIPIGQHHPAPGDWPFRTSATMAHSVMSPEVVAREPAKYLGFWKAWWRDNQAAAMGSSR